MRRPLLVTTLLLPAMGLAVIAAVPDAVPPDDPAQTRAALRAALAARIQQAEAAILVAETRLALATRERAALREELGREQQPVVHLTAALQQFSRRPLALSSIARK